MSATWSRLLVEMLLTGQLVGLAYLFVAVPKTPMVLGALLALTGAFFPSETLSRWANSSHHEQARVHLGVFDVLNVRIVGAARPILCVGGIAIMLVVAVTTLIEQRGVRSGSGMAATSLAADIRSLEDDMLNNGIEQEDLIRRLRQLERDALDGASRHCDDPVIRELLAGVESRLILINETPRRNAGDGICIGPTSPIE